MRTASGLIGQVASFDNLLDAFLDAGGSGRRWYSRQWQALSRDTPAAVLSMREDILCRTLVPLPPTRFVVYEPKMRDVTAPHMRDVIIQNAMLNVMNPYILRKFIVHTYSCVPGRGQLAACQRLQSMMRKASARWPHGWYMGKYDFRKYFANIDHDWMYACLERVFSDRDLMWLVRLYMEDYGPVGLSLGSPLSQPLANLNATPLDHMVMDDLGAGLYCRYMDDGRFIVESRDEAEDILDRMDRFVTEKMRQQFNWDKTRVVRGPCPDTFCGYRIHPNFLEVPRAAVQKAERRIAKLYEDWLEHRIPFHRLLSSIQCWQGQASHAIQTERTRALAKIPELP